MSARNTAAQLSTRERLARERAEGRTALDAVKRAIREPYAWPGGYPVHTIMADGEMLCAKCARAEFRQIAAATLYAFRGDCWRAAGAGILWETPDGPQYCAHCGEELQSAYGSSE